MIIDFHTHAFPARLVPKIRERYGGGGWELSSDGTISGLKSAMASNGVEKCVVLNLVTNPASQTHVNQFALDSADSFVVPFGSVHPRAPGWEAQLETLRQAGIRGIKLHPGDQGYAVDDPNCVPLYRKISKLGFITLFHVDSRELGFSRNCLPQALARVVDAFEGSPVVCAHMGGALRVDDDFKLLSSLPVWMDTSLSSLRPDRDVFREMVEFVCVDRVLFGSDSPWTSQAREIQAVKSLGLSPAEEEKLFFGNANRLLGIR